MHKSFHRAVITGLLFCLSSVACAATCRLFNAEINSTVSGPYSEVSNTVREPVIVRDEGIREHSVELLIRFPGDLNAFDIKPGFIELMSNSAFARNEGIASAGFDLGAVATQSNGQFVFQLDPGMAQQAPQPNVFTAQGISASSGGLGGICFLPSLKNLCEQTQGAAVLQVLYLIPNSGSVVFGFPANDAVDGTIDIVGYGYDNPNLKGRYHARFTGTLADQGEC